MIVIRDRDRARIGVNWCADCEAFFGRSLFFVGEFGVNDYQFLFGKRTVPDISSNIVPTIVGTIRQAIEVLCNIAPSFPAYK